MQSRAVLIGLASQPFAAACRVRAWSSAWAFFAASPRCAMALPCAAGIAASPPR